MWFSLIPMILCSSVATSVLVSCGDSRPLSMHIHTDVDKYKIMLFFKNECTPYTIVRRVVGISPCQFTHITSISHCRVRMRLLTRDARLGDKVLLRNRHELRTAGTRSPSFSHRGMGAGLRPRPLYLGECRTLGGSRSDAPALTPSPSLPGLRGTRTQEEVL